MLIYFKQDHTGSETTMSQMKNVIKGPNGQGNIYEYFTQYATIT